MSASQAEASQCETRANGARAFVSRIAHLRAFRFVILVALAVACAGTSHAQTSPGTQAQTSQLSQDQPSEAERASYAEALAYCRGDVPRPLALRSDKLVLCLDGMIDNPIDPWTVHDLAQGGLFVVRSAGGKIRTAIQLADLLLSKQATVIVNDYCLANCANYLFFASLATFVPRESLVAWRNVVEPGECPAFSETRDPGAPLFNSGPCDRGFHDGRRYRYFDQYKQEFYSARVRRFQLPESVAIRRTFKRKFDETGKYPENVFWTWNPRFYSMYRTKVFYEAYPESQDEVDAIAAHIGLHEHIIYDP